MRKIRLAFFIDFYRPGAGTENQLKGLLQNLDSSEVEATLFTLRGEVSREHRAEIPCPIITLKVARLASLKGATRFLALIRLLRREKYDIVSVYFDDSNLFVVPACRLAGIRNVIVNRRNMGYTHRPKIMGKLKWVNRHAAWVLANSYAVKEKVAELEQFPENRIHVIHNANWDDWTGDFKAVDREKLGFPGHCHIVGIVANLRPVKRIDLFIRMAARVASRMSTARFLILGSGTLEVDLKKQVESLGLGDKILFLGHQTDVRSYLSIFDIGVLTSESEGLSNTLIEYLRMGIPSIAFDTGGNHEIIKDGVGGYLVPPGDIEGMSDKVVELLTDNDHRQRLGTAGRAFAETSFDAEKIMRETMAFYRMVINGR